jgi:hypothetical protein
MKYIAGGVTSPSSDDLRDGIKKLWLELSDDFRKF